MANAAFTPGLIALFGSGETAPNSGVTYDRLAEAHVGQLKIAILETPAGFQPNATQVAGKIAQFLRVRLQQRRPAITQIEARARGTALSPDDPNIAAPLADANLIFFGPGSPTYTVRQLSNSYCWQLVQARHRVGAALASSSAATIALGKWALPVYEIYKVGSDVHWQPGLDLFGLFGLELVLMPHWNNTDGGSELDTSHCFMGIERFHQLRQLLPGSATIVGIDEHTALIIDLAQQSCQVLGQGSVTLFHEDQVLQYSRNSTFDLSKLGQLRWPELTDGIDSAVWQRATTPLPVAAPQPSAIVLQLLEQRQAARADRNWQAADQLRQQLLEQGWQILDTPSGPLLEPLNA
jgi:hypothetical protein